MKPIKTAATFAVALAAISQSLGQNPPAYTFTINPIVRHLINPNIYGVSYIDSNFNNVTQSLLQDLNTPLVRVGGDLMSTYNWAQNADNHGGDYYYESILENGSTAGALPDSIFSTAKSAGGTAMITMPFMGYVANLGANGATTWSFSVNKYGAQESVDPFNTDAGNGILSATGQPITNNNPTDACELLNTTNNAQSFVNHLVNKWGTAANGGVKYYVMDNEPGAWYGVHQDVHPTGDTMDEINGDITATAKAVRGTDPSALIVGPEECNWATYFYSGSDIQWANKNNGWGNPNNFPDRKAHGDKDYLPWLLQQLNAASKAYGSPLLNVFSLHWYPQGDEYNPYEAQSSQDSASNQAARNATTRSLWDPTYVDPDLSAQTGSNVIPNLANQMNTWINNNYPGLQKGITEYNWGDEAALNGATTQADLFGIFGKYGYDMATRWGIPASSTPTYQAMKIFRNYDGADSAFGDIAVNVNEPSPNNVTVYPAIRSSDGTMTIVAINKTTSNQTVQYNFGPGFVGRLQGNDTLVSRYQISSANPSSIASISPIFIQYSGSTAYETTDTLPAQSITLYEVKSSGVLYDFTRYSGDGFETSNTAVSIGTSGAYKYGGTGGSFYGKVPANNTASTLTINLHVYYPSVSASQTVTVPTFFATGTNTGLSAKPYVIANGKTYYGASTSVQGAFQALTVAIPANAPMPISQLGLQLSQKPNSNGGTVYISNVQSTL